MEEHEGGTLMAGHNAGPNPELVAEHHVDVSGLYAVGRDDFTDIVAELFEALSSICDLHIDRSLHITFRGIGDRLASTNTMQTELGGILPKLNESAYLRQTSVQLHIPVSI